MSQQKGKTLDLTFTLQRIDIAISNLNRECFTPEDIHKITGVNKVIIDRFLSQKTKRGFLEIIKPDCYRKISDRSLTKKMPLAFVATKVWEILRQSDKPLTLREISEIIEKNTGLNVYFSIANTLFRWHHRSVLDKLGGKRPYAYKIRLDYKDQSRPLASLPF